MKTSAILQPWFAGDFPEILAILLVLTVSAQSAEPQMYAVTFNDRKLLIVDTNTGAASMVTNLTIKPMDLAVSGGGLYILSDALGAQRLSEIDPLTGETGRQLTFTNIIAGGEGAFDFSTNGVAFASRSSSATGTVFRLEIASTNATLVTPEGGLSPSLDGLAFDSDGTLFGLSQNRGGHHALYHVNVDSGQTTLVGDLGVNFAANGLFVAGLAFAPDGTLYAALGGGTDSELYRVNKTTGTAAFVGSIGFPGVSGIRFYQPPPGPLTIGFAGPAVRVSWPHARGGVLQICQRLGGDWADAYLPVSTNGAEAVVFAPRDGTQVWFRLKQ